MEGRSQPIKKLENKAIVTIRLHVATGITKHLREALADFEDKDVEEVMKAVKDESRDFDEFIHAKSELVEFFKKYDIADINDIDACVAAHLRPNVQLSPELVP
jgi:pyridoxine 5'-phosphate synthase PdxJ